MLDFENEIRSALKRTYGEQPICYMKISYNLDWIKDIENGKLYLNTVQYFRDLEKRQLKDKRKTNQSDGKELKLTINAENFYFADNETGNILLHGEKADFTLDITGDNEIRVFCIMGFCVDDFIIESYTENEVVLKFPYDDRELLKNLKDDFGDHAIIIEGIQFRKRLKEVLDSTKREFLFDKIEYAVSNRLDRVQAFNELSAKRFFYKDVDFDYQRESRIIVLDEIEGDYLEIGSIAEFCGQLLTDDIPNQRLKFIFTTKEKEG